MGYRYMSRHLSEKENFLRVLRGETPEYVPIFKLSDWWFQPPAISDVKTETGYINLYGVEFVSHKSANGGALPKPGHILFDDIRKWRDVIKRPPILDEIDWERMAKKDLDNWDPDRLRMCCPNISFGYFQALMSFMGFTNGLIACFEEPEEVKELMHFLLDINLEIGKNILKYYKPDVYNMGDDIAHERSPFVSEDIFLDLFEPMWRAEVAPFVEAGVPAEHHNCGKFEAFVPYLVDMGYSAWDPAQSSNNLLGIKAKYGRKLTICTGIEGNGFCSWPETTEEEIRAEVRRVMDLYAPDGGYCFCGGILGPADDEETAKRNGWIKDEYEKNKYKYY